MVNQSIDISKELTQAAPATEQNGHTTRSSSSTFTPSPAERTKFLNNWVVAPQTQTEAPSPTPEGRTVPPEQQNGSHPTASSVATRQDDEIGRAQSRSWFTALVRRHFLKIILTALDAVQPHAGTPDAAPAVNKILHAIRDLDERSPNDPALSLLWALYDALTHNGQWSLYSAQQFEQAQQIICKIDLRENLQTHQVEKAIGELATAGFDTLPFPLLLDENEQPDEMAFN